MKWYENLKCTHAFILHSFPMIKGLPIVSVLYPFGHWMNFRNYTWDSLPFKTISHLTMVRYHQNLIRRTLGLTISSFFMMTNLGYLGDNKSPPQTKHGSIEAKILNDKHNMQNFNRKRCEFWKYHIIYNNIAYSQNKTDDMEMSCMCVSPWS